MMWPLDVPSSHILDFPLRPCVSVVSFIRDDEAVAEDDLPIRSTREFDIVCNQNQRDFILPVQFRHQVQDVPAVFRIKISGRLVR